MATIPTITTIQKTECIGNSLVILNDNYDNIKNSFSDVNDTLLNIEGRINALNTFATKLSSAQLAKAWVSFSGIKDSTGNNNSNFTNRQIFTSYNVTTVKKENTGVYTINFGIPLEPEYVATGCTSPGGSYGSGTDTGVIGFDPDGNVTNLPIDQADFGKKSRIFIMNLLGSSIDPEVVTLSFFCHGSSLF